MRSAAFLLSALLFLSCNGPKQTVLAIWNNPDKPVYGTQPSVFIMVLTANLPARNQLETDILAQAEKMGLKATTSVKALGPMNVGKDFPAQAILEKAQSMGFQTIFTVAVKDVKSETHFVKASENYYQPMNYGYYNRFDAYYNGYWGGPWAGIGFGNLSGFTPSYTTEKKTLFMESNLYAVNSKDLLLSIQSKAVDPQNLEKESKKFSENILSALKEGKKMANLK
ncbi:MAG: hypothetical protein EAZ62_00260 [Sphingobacteriia bacterium]|nr:MAG: hypothetical protein EAZ62_00260 [Sphingobacteriia bacterium]